MFVKNGLKLLCKVAQELIESNTRLFWNKYYLQVARSSFRKLYTKIYNYVHIQNDCKTVVRWKSGLRPLCKLKLLDWFIESHAR